MTRKGPKPIPTGISLSEEQLAKPPIVFENRVRPPRKGGNPGAGQRLVQPNAGFLPNRLRDGSRDDGRLGFDRTGIGSDAPCAIKQFIFHPGKSTGHQWAGVRDLRRVNFGKVSH